MHTLPANILVVGVAVLDFVFRLDELPRRAEKYRAQSADMVGGGNAANAAVGIARLGASPLLAARLGADAVGDMIIADLVREGVDCTLIRRFEGRKSSYSSIYMDRAGERQIVNFRDTDITWDAGWLLEAPLPAITAALADTRWPQGALAAMQIAAARGVPGIIDVEQPAHESAAAIRVASHAAFSAQGLRDFTGVDDPEAGLAATGLRGWQCVTDGANGVWWRHGDRHGHVPAFAIEPVDTLGAGDLWHGAFALALSEGSDETSAIVFANAAAAIKCTRHGGRTGAPTRDETEAYMRHHASETKVVFQGKTGE